VIPVKVGAVTVDVECPPLEQAIGVIKGVGHAMYGLAGALEQLASTTSAIDEKVTQIRDAAVGAPRIEFILGPVSEQSINRSTQPMASTQVLKATQQSVAALAIRDARENPARIDGVPTWSSSDETRVTVAAAEDGLSATIKAVGPLTESPVQINVLADADLGEGVRTIQGVLEVTVIAGDAVTIAITPGPAEEQQ
jgi:hypothetical protein